MPTETLRPNADVVIGIEYPTGTHYDDVDEVSPDGDATYVRVHTNSGSKSQYDLYGLPASAGEGTINYIKVYVVAKRSIHDIAERAYTKIKTGGTEYQGAANNLTSSYLPYSTQYNTNPKTSVAWTWADIDALQIGVRLYVSTDKASSGARCTQVYVEVNYTPVVAPTVSTVAADNVEETTANPRGNVTATGGENPTRYIDYDTDSGAPYANAKNCGVGGTGTYNSNLTGLSPGQKYYYRARAVNSGGTGTGSEMTFTTKPNPPTAMSATVVSSTRIDVSWTKGTGAEKTMVRRKVGSYPTSVSDGDQAYFDTGSSFSDTGLVPGKHYYYRAWSYKTGAPNAGYSDEYAQDDGETPYPHSYGYIIG